jgi:hypothetical protein
VLWRAGGIVDDMDDMDNMDGGQVKTLSVSSILSRCFPAPRLLWRAGGIVDDMDDMDNMDGG